MSILTQVPPGCKTVDIRVVVAEDTIVGSEWAIQFGRRLQQATNGEVEVLAVQPELSEVQG